MKLKELLQGIKVLECTADLETEITSIAYDSRKAEQGGLFVAISGFTSDGNRFIPMAVDKGAAVVVTAKKPKLTRRQNLPSTVKSRLFYFVSGFFLESSHL